MVSAARSLPASLTKEDLAPVRSSAQSFRGHGIGYTPPISPGARRKSGFSGPVRRSISDQVAQNIRQRRLLSRDQCVSGPLDPSEEDFLERIMAAIPGTAVDRLVLPELSLFGELRSKTDENTMDRSEPDGLPASDTCVADGDAAQAVASEAECWTEEAEMIMQSDAGLESSAAPDGHHIGGDHTISPSSAAMAAYARAIITGKPTASHAQYSRLSPDLSAFYVVDLGHVARQYWQFRRLLPRVRPHYAVKCNPDRSIVAVLAALGCGFDCASRTEIDLVMETCAALAASGKEKGLAVGGVGFGGIGIDPRRIVYANPCKAPQQIRYALEKYGVSLMTFDNELELYKVRDVYWAACKAAGVALGNSPTSHLGSSLATGSPGGASSYHGSASGFGAASSNNQASVPVPRLLLRIATHDQDSLCPLSSKYGASLEDVPELLRVARELGIRVVGVAFHVGSGARSFAAYYQALQDARKVFDQAELILGEPMTVLDVGGGFPAHDGDAPITFPEIASRLGPALEELFPAASGVDVIAEPGRYFVGAAQILVTQVISARPKHMERSTKETAPPSRGMDYYIGDGMYGSFKDAALLGVTFTPRLLLPEPVAVHTSDSYQLHPVRCTIFGPTCDSLDVVRRDVILPQPLQIGDWLWWTGMGAYTLSLAGGFNGFTPPPCFYVCGMSPSSSYALVWGRNQEAESVTAELVTLRRLALEQRIRWARLFAEHSGSGSKTSTSAEHVPNADVTHRIACASSASNS
jgi:ornithine decarboxylase